MKNIYKIYVLTSILFLIVFAVTPIKLSFSEWRQVQKKYNQIIKNLPQKEKPVPVKLQQIWARDLNHIDRCTTCHLGMNNIKMNKAPQPFRTHPKMYHDLNKLGCTICHDGQGLATNYSDSHLPSESWDKPILPKRYLESSCGRCHINENLKETATLNFGRKLVGELKCYACHNHQLKFNTFTPSLDGIGRKVKHREWLVRWLKNPKAIRQKTKMPNFVLSNEEVHILVDFLMSFKTFPNDVLLNPVPDFYSRRKEKNSFIELGKKLFRDSPCISCHSINGQGGKLAPDLAKIASKAKEIWLFNFIKNPKRLQPGVEMPQFGFSDEEVAAITAYMTSEFIDWDEAEKVSSAYQPQPDFYERGQAIFYKYNCKGCHQLFEFQIPNNRGPDHTAIGSKKNYQIYFGETTIPHTLYNYIETKLKTPRVFGETMRMPDFDLSEKDRQAITTYLLSLRFEDLPQKYIRKGAEQAAFNPQGKIGKIFQKFSCLKCHTINGTGGAIAPDLSIVGSRLRSNWIKKFFKNPNSRRPHIEERMLTLFISDEEIETLANYFYTVLLDDSISITSDWKPTHEAQIRGNKLYWEKYGCQSCHLVKGKGGNSGPSLDSVGDRLQPGWMLHWLLNPQKYIPDTIEPRSGMSVSEAKDVVAYLMSL